MMIVVPVIVPVIKHNHSNLAHVMDTALAFIIACVILAWLVTVLSDYK